MAQTRAGSTQVVLLLGAAGQLLVGLALTVLLGRVLGAAEFGVFALVAAGFVFARDATDLGSSAVVAREIVYRPADERRLIEGLLLWRTLLGAALGLGVLGLALQQEDALRRSLLLAMALCLAAFGPTAFQAVFQARERQLGPTLLALLGQLAVLLACLLLLRSGPLGLTPAALLVAKEALVLVGLAAMGLQLMRQPPRLWPDGAALHATMALVGLWALAALCRHLMGQIELLAVALWHGSAQVGALAAALRPLSPALLLPWLLSPTLVPPLAIAARMAPERGHTLLLQALLLAGGVGALLATAGVLLAPDLMTLLYGGRYDAPALGAASAMRWQAASLLPVPVAAVASAAMLAWRREGWSLAVIALALGLKLLATAALVPTGGLVVATQVGLVAELGLALALCVALWQPLRAAARAAPLARGLLVIGSTVLVVVLAWSLLGEASPAIRVGVVAGATTAGLVALLKSSIGRRYRQALKSAVEQPACTAVN